MKDHNSIIQLRFVYYLQKLGGDSEDGISEDHLVLLGSAANGDTKFLGMNSHFADSERSIDVLGHNSGKALDKSTVSDFYMSNLMSVD